MICVYVWEFYWDRTRRVSAGRAGGLVPAPGRRGEQTSADGPDPVTDSVDTETRGSTSCQHCDVMCVMWDTVWDVNEEAHEASVKIQFCFGRVPIHSWTWQIFFIINHMLARTQPAQLIAQRVFALLWWEFEFLNWNGKNRQWTFEWERGGYWL